MPKSIDISSSDPKNDEQSHTELQIKMKLASFSDQDEDIEMKKKTFYKKFDDVSQHKEHVSELDLNDSPQVQQGTEAQIERQSDQQPQRQAP